MSDYSTAMQKKRYCRHNAYSFPGTDFTVAMSLRPLGNMGRDLLTPNRKKFYTELGINAERIRTLRQVHSKDIVLSENWREGCAGDGIISTNPKEILGVTTADCVPVFVFHPSGTVFAAFHSGWKGTGIVSKGIRQMCKDSGVNPEELHAFIGPAIGPCCYNVDNSRGEEFRGRFGADAADCREGTWYLNLQGVNAALLRGEGVSIVYIDSDCTSCNLRYGSYRREGRDTFTLMLFLGSY